MITTPEYTRFLKATKRFVHATVMAVCFFGPASVLAADEVYLQLEGISGDATTKGFGGAVEILNWDWGMTRRVGRAAKARTTAKINFQQLNIVHHLDSATPGLMQMCATGKRIANARLSLRRQGAPSAYLIIDMKNILVSSVEVSGSSSDTRPSETVSLQPGEVRLTYATVDRSGKKLRPQTFNWSVTANRPL